LRQLHESKKNSGPLGHHEMKTTRDIKSSLEEGRRRRAPSRTRFIEHKLRMEIDEEFGDVLTDEERAKIEEKGIRWVEHHNYALKSARMNILRAKEKASILHEIRSGKEATGEEVRRTRRRTRTKSRPKRQPKGKGFDEINLEY
jgi:hypothetical protein